ncbi:YdeI/OmpD-associated family protein [Halobacillus aidingensis]|uniref:Bacteriocin-protection, YdeI or OmpD-Associated n=1 Tax=Halobacillus aidingensis TaxID=240303 RepID=A0A1H0G4R2_HALAD|nr:YdeI/OmpD-associated family protein [Halobacillus aidingensis]SDO01739.1 Bacteriocin-protection, YdeI or OmpD-Associated [Halobacillus aidingensis]
MPTIKDKLKLSKYKNLAVLHQPEDYHLFDEQPTTLSEHHDAIFIFVKNLEEMKEHLQTLLDHEGVLTEKGYVFFAYPKKGNTRYDTYIHRDDMFPALRIGEDKYVEGSDIKFSRMVSMDDVFTVVGMKREKKKAPKTTPPSQCVSDYEHKIEEVENLLKDHPFEQEFYRSLTPGYKRDWARQVFSAKQQSTRDKRAKQMIEVLVEGYKSLDLYRRKKK